MSTERENSFEEFVIRECKERNLTLGRLCEGLYSKDMVSKIKNKKRNIDILTKNRLLGRLGIPEDNFQKYLNKKEYGRWVERQKILIAMEKKDKTKAVDQIKQYREHGFENILEEQFCLTMEAELLTEIRANRAEIKEKLYQAISLTIPNIEELELKEGMWSIQELNLILEYTRYARPQKMEKICKEMFQYLQEHKIDLLCLAKIYPRIVLKKWKGKVVWQEWEIRELLEICDKAIEIENRAKRRFFWLELLQMKMWCIEHSEYMEQSQKKRSYERIKEEIEDFLSLCRRCKVQAKMTGCKDLYHEYGVSQLHNILKRRRKMLNITQQDLCAGICSKRTFVRIEQGITSPQSTIIKGLLQRLRLPSERSHARLTWKKRDGIQTYHEINVCMEKDGYEKLKEKLRQLEEKISFDVIGSIQILESKETILLFTKEQIKKSECITKLKKILGYTIPYQDALQKEGPIYLTISERLCAFYIAYYSIKDRASILKKLCEFYQEERNSYNPYGYMEEYIRASKLMAEEYRRSGRMEEAEQLDYCLQVECLKNRVCFWSDVNAPHKLLRL